MAEDLPPADRVPLPMALSGGGRFGNLPAAVAVSAPEPGVPRRELDYAMLAILVRVQHLRHAEALTLIDGLLALGHRSAEVLLARAVVEYALGQHEAVLETVRELDRLEPPEFRAGKRIDPRVRVRSYLKARSIWALTGRLDDEGRASLDFYLRQGRDQRQRRG